MLKELIEHYEYISFDVFDTLIRRTVIDPEDIFDMVQCKYNQTYKDELVDFRKKRIEAEKNARAKSSKQDITFRDIYSCLGINAVQKELVMDLEIIMEINTCIPNRSMREIFNWVSDKGKKIIIITDMYLEKEVILKMLKKCGIESGKYEKLYVSGEIGLTKKSGDLFQYVMDDLKITGNSMLHIGDNYVVDYINSKAKGCDAYLVNNIDGKENLYWKKNKNKTSIGLMHLLSFLEKSGDEIRSQGEKLGYCLVGPFLYNYCIWIHELKKKNQIDKLVFLSREGYLPYKIYKVLYPEETADMVYLRINRKTLLPVQIYIDSSLENFVESLPKDKGIFTVHSLLNNLYPVNMDTIKKIIPNRIDLSRKIEKNLIAADEEFKEIYNVVIDHLKEYYKTQYEYIILYLNENQVSGKILLINNSVNASAQRQLNNIIKHAELPIDLWAAHYVIRKEVIPCINQKCFIWFDDTCMQYAKRLFYRHCLLFEHLLFEDAGTAECYYERDGKIYASLESHNSEQQNDDILKEIRKGAYKFIRSYRVIEPLPMTGKENLDAWIKFIMKPDKEDIELISGLVDVDDKNVINFIEKDISVANYKNAYWKQGYLLCYKNYIKLFLLNTKLKCKPYKKIF